MIYSGIKKIALLFILAVTVFVLPKCVMEKEPEAKTEIVEEPGINLDLPEIIERGTLTVLAENSSTSYFMYRGKKMGFEYELLKQFAEEIGVKLKVKIVKNLDSLIVMLNRGDGDIIACNYTVTRDRAKILSFSEPFMEAQQVLVQRKPEGWKDMKEEEWKEKVLNDPAQLANKSVQVWQNSSYYQRLMHLQEEIGDTILIEGLQGNIGGEELIEMVAEGIIDYTITEENVARVNEQFFDNIYTGLDLSVKQKLAFGMRQSSHLLKARIDEWLLAFKERSTYKFIARKYFDSPHLAANNGTNYTQLNGSEISQFDDAFKRAAEMSGWDWRMIAAVAYQESKFNPNIQGFGGSYGMMQFMPNTGPHYGVYPDSPPAAQIMGGARKLMADEKHWKQIPDEVQRKKFALASYNAGRGHIMDAQRLAKKHGVNPLVWDNNVETMLLNLSKQEYYQDEVVRHGMMRSRTTYKYVREVMARYHEWAAIYQ